MPDRVPESPSRPSHIKNNNERFDRKQDNPLAQNEGMDLRCIVRNTENMNQ